MKNNFTEVPPTTETSENLPEKRTRFFNRIRSKFLAMAAAGFITLGGGWEKGFADQLHIKPPENGKVAEFVLETAITTEKLQSFKEKISKEEPEFAEWVAGYSNYLKDQHGKVIDIVSNYNIGGDDDLEKKRDLRSYFDNSNVDEFTASNIISSIIQRDRDIINNLNKNPEWTGHYREFVDNNLDEIIWSIVFLENSREVRNNKLKYIGSTNISFNMYDIHSARGLMAYQTFKKKKVDVFYPTLNMLPIAFMSRSNETPDFNVYINIFIHELIHALNASEDNQLGGLKEGLTQNMTLEVVQYLGEKDEEIKPAVGITAYDIRVIVAGFLESVFRSQEYSHDTLAKWHTEIISDEEMIRNLKQSLGVLGLDKEIGSDILSLDNQDFWDFWENRGGIDKFKETLLNIMARLKMRGVNLTPEFLKAMMINNRSLDDWQVDNFEKTIELGSISTKVDKRMIQIHKSEVNKTRQK